MLRCGCCPFRCSTPDEFSLHQAENHLWFRYFSCSNCGQRFPHKSSVVQHIIESHNSHRATELNKLQLMQRPQQPQQTKADNTDYSPDEEGLCQDLSLLETDEAANSNGSRGSSRGMLEMGAKPGATSTSPPSIAISNPRSLVQQPSTSSTRPTPGTAGTRHTSSSSMKAANCQVPSASSSTSTGRPPTLASSAPAAAAAAAAAVRASCPQVPG